ncbi:transposase domain-containing protein, partial [Rhodoblastus acidophilus]|uniref:transposase domain-containing protein n=1 Tax=Rhodoblastus acidophilus TaxID=1074 RepID=UPI001FEE03D9
LTPGERGQSRRARKVTSRDSTVGSYRPIPLGRKNWLFAGSDKGGSRAAGVLSLIETAKLNGLDPEAYLRTVLARIADYPAKKIADLLPWGDVFQAKTA